MDFKFNKNFDFMDKDFNNKKIDFNFNKNVNNYN